MKKILLSFVIAAVAWIGYQKWQNPASCEAVPLAENSQCRSPIAMYENPERIPLRNFVLNELGDLSGKTILDIGAGPGFFAFEMAQTADKVIATEIDPLFLNYMNEKKANLGLENMEVRLAGAEFPELQNTQADYALMVYMFHYLHDPKAFLQALKQCLRPEGKVFIANAQLSSVIIQDYLEMTGFTGVEEQYFSYPQKGCGDLELQLISAEMPAQHTQVQ